MPSTFTPPPDDNEAAQSGPSGCLIAGLVVPLVTFGLFVLIVIGMCGR